MYQGRDGKLVETPTFQANFVSRRYVEKEDYGAEFIFQTFALSSATRVTNKEGDETDSVRFKVAAIHRSMAQPFEVQATDEYGVAEWLEDNLEKDMTLTINGQWINKYILKQVERPNPAGIGKLIVDTKREIENRTLVEGVAPVEDEESVDYITIDEMKDVMLDYYYTRHIEVFGLHLVFVLQKVKAYVLYFDFLRIALSFHIVLGLF